MKKYNKLLITTYTDQGWIRFYLDEHDKALKSFSSALELALKVYKKDSEIVASL